MLGYANVPPCVFQDHYQRNNTVGIDLYNVVERRI